MSLGLRGVQSVCCCCCWVLLITFVLSQSALTYTAVCQATPPQEFTWPDPSAHVLVTIANCSTTNAPRLSFTSGATNVTIRLLNSSTNVDIEIAGGPSSNLTIAIEQCSWQQVSDAAAAMSSGGFVAHFGVAAASGVSLVLSGQSVVTCGSSGCLAGNANLSSVQWLVLDRSVLSCVGGCSLPTSGPTTMADFNIIIDNSTLRCPNACCFRVAADSTISTFSLTLRNYSFGVALGLLNCAERIVARNISFYLIDSNLTTTLRTVDSYSYAVQLRASLWGLDIQILRSSWEVSAFDADFPGGLYESGSCGFLILEPPFDGRFVTVAVLNSTIDLSQMVKRTSMALGIVAKSDTGGKADPSSNVTDAVFSIYNSTLLACGPGRLTVFYFDRTRLYNVTLELVQSSVNITIAVALNMTQPPGTPSRLSREASMLFFVGKFPLSLCHNVVKHADVHIHTIGGSLGLTSLTTSETSLINLPQGSDVTTVVEDSRFTIQVVAPLPPTTGYTGTIELFYISSTTPPSIDMLSLPLDNSAILIRRCTFDVAHHSTGNMLEGYLSYFFNVQQLAPSNITLELVDSIVTWDTQISSFAVSLGFGFVAFRDVLMKQSRVLISNSSITFNDMSTCGLLTFTNAIVTELNVTVVGSSFTSSLAQFAQGSKPSLGLILAARVISFTSPVEQTVIPLVLTFADVLINLTDSSFRLLGTTAGILTFSSQTAVTGFVFYASNSSFDLPKLPAAYKSITMPVGPGNSGNEIRLGCNRFETAAVGSQWLGPKYLTSMPTKSAWGNVVINASAPSAYSCVTVFSTTSTWTKNDSTRSVTSSASMSMCSMSGVTSSMCDGDALALYSGVLLVVLVFNATIVDSPPMVSSESLAATVGAVILSTTRLNNSALQFVLEKPKNDLFSLATDKQLLLSLPSSSFSCPRNDVTYALKVPSVSFSTSPPVRLAATATVAATLALVSPVLLSAVLSQQRSVMLLSLGTCAYSTSAPLDPSSSPTQLGFGSSDGFYLRGGLVGNSLLMLGFVAACAILVRLRMSQAGMSWMPAAADLGLPGRLVLPFLALLTPTVSCAVGIALYGGNGGLDTFLAFAVGLVLWVVAPLLLIVRIVVQRFGAVSRIAIDTTNDESSARLLDFFRSALDASRKVMRMHANVVWESRRGTSHKWFLERYEELFAQYSGPFHWFLAVEVVFAVLTGVIGGIMSNDPSVCATVQTAALILTLVMLITFTFVRPLNATGDFLLSQFQGSLAVICAIALVLSASTLSDVLAMTSMYFTSAACLAMALSKVATFVRDRRLKTLFAGSKTKGLPIAMHQRMTLAEAADAFDAAVKAVKELVLAVEAQPRRTAAVQAGVGRFDDAEARLTKLVELVCAEHMYQAAAARIQLAGQRRASRVP